MKIKYSLILLALLVILVVAGCAKPPGQYFVKTKEAYSSDYQTNEYTIDGDYLTMHGYWLGKGTTHYLDDYVINLSGVIAIWDGSNQVYPIKTEGTSFWEHVGSGAIPVHISIPLWMPFGVLAILFLLFFRFAAYEMLKVLIESLRARLPILDPSRQPWITKDIKLPDDTQGIIATRDWKLAHHNVLMSANQGLVWEDVNTKADVKPSAENTKGIYAYRLGTNIRRTWGKVSGIVSLTGHCVGHANGLVRSEKCQILMLFCMWPGTAKELSARYGVPVMLTFDKRRSLEQWMVSLDGIRWLKQNANIISEEKPLDREIEEIMEREGF